MIYDPFSSKQQWGWLINENGHFELFTREVDVVNMSDFYAHDKNFMKSISYLLTLDNKHFER